MKYILLALAFILFSFQANAQISVTYTINTNTGYIPISPYIFGSCNGGYSGANFMRQGGNRITGYNWENNASNAGQDYLHQSDDYLTWVGGINYPQDTIPGIVTTSFIDSCNAHNAFSAVTLQMAGYVAKDKIGLVAVGQTAPSSRWCAVQNTKPGPFSLIPSTADNTVYMDEYMNFLISNFGNATTTTGVKAFILDNETTLWPSTHPRIHPTAPTVVEMMQRSIALAKRVKQMDATVKVFGPESYGFYEYTQYQGASDWGSYSGTYPYFLSVYLDSMRLASIAAGHRLLDVLTVHWYPDVNVGNIYSTDTTASRVAERIQLPRSLWDNTYVEDGWIGQWYSGSLPILPTLQTQINTYYPNTQLGVTEYDYGADDHISGGLAQADALGAFARTGTSFASKWGGFSGFSLSAIRIYDDIAEPFTGFYTTCSSNDNYHSTVHCSVEDTVNKTLHIVALNKSLDSTVTAYFNITSDIGYDSINVYWFDKTSPTINFAVLPSSVVNMNVFQQTLNPGSVYHYVLRSTLNTSGLEEITNDGINIYPNPATNILYVKTIEQLNGEKFIWNIVDNNGKTVSTGNLGPDNSIQIENLASGNYLLYLISDKNMIIKKFVKQ